MIGRLTIIYNVQRRGFDTGQKNNTSENIFLESTRGYTDKKNYRTSRYRTNSSQKNRTTLKRPLNKILKILKRKV